MNDDSSSPPNIFSTKIDSKGRIYVPVEIRKSFGLSSTSKLILKFDLRKNLIYLEPVNGLMGEVDG